MIGHEATLLWEWRAVRLGDEDGGLKKEEVGSSDVR
jgi:hypothetical protein